MALTGSDAAPYPGGPGADTAAVVPAALLDHLSVALLVEAANGQIASINSAFRSLFGLTSDDALVGRDVGDGLRALFRGPTATDSLAPAQVFGPAEKPTGSGRYRTERDGRAIEVSRAALPEGGALWEFRDVGTASGARHASMMDNAPLVLFALDPEGVITTVEGGIPDLNAAQLAAFVGRPLLDVLNELRMPHLFDPFTRALAGESVLTSAQMPSGLFDVHLTPVRDASGALQRVLGVVHDSAPRQHNEHLLRRHNDYLEALHQTTLELVNRLDLDDLLQSITERAAALVGAGHGYIYLVEPDESRIVVRYGSGIFKDFIGFSMERGEGIAGKVWATGSPLVVDDYDSWAGRSEAFDRNLITAVACVPLRVGGRVAGVIGVSQVDAQRRFHIEEVRLLNQLGELASLALENARLYQSAQAEISERRRTEAALRQSEARYRSVITAMGEGIIVVDASGVISDVNATAEHIFAISRGELVGQKTSVFATRLIQQDGVPFPPAEYPALVTLATGKPQAGVLMGVRHEDDHVTWISVNSQPIIDPDGRAAAVVVSFSNITEHKKVQAELHQRIDMLAALQQIDVDLSRSLSVDYVLQTALKVTSHLTGATDGFIAVVEDGQPHTIIATSGDAQAAEQRLRKWQSGDVWSKLAAARQPQLLEGAAALHIVLPLVSQERLTGLIALECHPSSASYDQLAFLELVSARISAALDNARLFQVSQTQLNELRAVYTQLKDLEQLKTQMIRVAAHDLRSPLGVISGYVTILHEDLGEAGAEYEPFFDAIFRALGRMEQMTTDILSLERIHATNEDSHENLLLNDLVGRVSSDHRDQALVKGIAFETALTETPLPIRADAVQIYEAVANLINNAIKYTPEGGRITVRLNADGERACFEVQDTGYGVPLEAQAALFQPFYRVKTDETRLIDGTGLGLYLVKGIIERHKGAMQFQSEPGRGSTFGFSLPLADPNATT